MKLLRYQKRVRGLFLASLVLLFLSSALTAAKAWIIQPVVDTFRRQGATARDLLLLCGGICAIFLLQAVLTYVYSLLSRMAGSRIVRAIREDLFAHLLRQGAGYPAERGSADLASRVVNDVAAFEAATVTELQALFRDAATLLLLFGVLLYQSLSLAFLCLLVLAAVGLILFGMNRRIRALSRRVQETISGLSRQLAEMIGGLEVVLTFGLAPRWRERFRELNAEHYGTVIGLQRASFAGTALVQGVMGFGLAALVFLTGRSLLRGEITEGQFLSFLGTLYLMQGPAVDVGQRVTQVSRGLAAGSRALELFADEPDRDEPADPQPLPDSALGFAFRGVTFGYGEQPLLHDVSFEVAPGELVVLMGESGGGKTTIARLLLRFYRPREGSLLLGGVPLEQVGRRDLSRAVSYVAQDVFLFEGTIRNNVCLGRPDASDEEVAQVLRICCLDRFVAELPRGLETSVGERGLQLSGGQRQRIAIARALLMEPRLLVLDEATSALDMAMEKRLLHALAESSGRRTVFAITHRPGAAELADRVLVLRDGRLEGDQPPLADTSSRKSSGTRSRSRPVSSR
ncbi:MAG TPA: ABC transporter ATP-binding protein [Thermoanaerobaculia bacterium]|nr:ABC transporter ATP-binding protein [Thermoanaerobaculia bacterium]